MRRPVPPTFALGPAHHAPTRSTTLRAHPLGGRGAPTWTISNEPTSPTYERGL